MTEGRHFKSDLGRSDTHTRSFSPPLSHSKAGYFMFTLLICLLLAFLAAAVLSVDYFGRAVSEGAEPTFNFSLSDEGRAELSLLGRDYSADLSFLAPVTERISSGVEALKNRFPKCITYIFGAIPKIYNALAELISQAGNYIRELITGK